ncbi:MAG TPA: hypothetical protein VF516_01665 [Kofleriaceae bacterium]
MVTITSHVVLAGMPPPTVAVICVPSALTSTRDATTSTPGQCSATLAPGKKFAPSIVSCAPPWHTVDGTTLSTRGGTSIATSNAVLDAQSAGAGHHHLLIGLGVADPHRPCRADHRGRQDREHLGQGRRVLAVRVGHGHVEHAGRQCIGRHDVEPHRRLVRPVHAARRRILRIVGDLDRRRRQHPAGQRGAIAHQIRRDR